MNLVCLFLYIATLHDNAIFATNLHRALFMKLKRAGASDSGIGFGVGVGVGLDTKYIADSYIVGSRGVDIQRRIPVGFNSDSWKYQARTHNQKIYVDHLINPNITVLAGIGPAGCGKTLFACNAAVTALKCGIVDRIVITRPLISVDEEELGFLPGSITNKMDPWTRPIFDILKETFSATQIKYMMDNGVIEISPLAYMRGRTFKRAFIIADEMQNSSPKQMLLMLTRVGEDSRLVITGDLNQSDRPGVNGLYDFVEKIKRAKENTIIRIAELGHPDIQRSRVVSRILDIYAESTASISVPLKNDNDNDSLLSNNTTLGSENESVSDRVSVSESVSESGGVIDSINEKPVLNYVKKAVDSDCALIPKQWYIKLQR